MSGYRRIVTHNRQRLLYLKGIENSMCNESIRPEITQVKSSPRDGLLEVMSARDIIDYCTMCPLLKRDSGWRSTAVDFSYFPSLTSN